MKHLKSSASFVIASLAVTLALVVAGFSAATVQAGEEDPVGSSLTITATDHHFDVPAQVEAGLVTVTMVNEGEDLHHGQFARLNDDVSFDDFTAALQEGPEAIFPLLSFTGGPGLIPPGGEQTVILDLEPGQYVLLCFIEDEEGVPHVAHGMIEPVEVVEAMAPDAAEAPAADATIILQDFAFDMPSELAAGEYTWEVVNEGPEPHEIILLKVAPGVTLDEAIEALMEDPEADDEVPAGPPPFEPYGGMQGLSAGLTGWVIVDLEAGEYLAICVIPSPANEGAPHIALGMFAPLTVTDDVFQVEDTVVTTEESVNFRAAPVDGEIIDTLPVNTELRVTGAPEEDAEGFLWYPLANDATGESGYIREDLIGRAG